METASIRPMGDRSYGLVPVDRITILNSRDREKGQFQENVRSIGEVGLMKPVVVNGRGFKETGFYDLVCGEGRYLAYKQLGKAQIPAEIVDCDRKTALLYSLVENIARVPPGTMWFAREAKRMHDAGWSFDDIARVVGKSDSYVRGYIRLAEKGEERLIKGVEQDLFPMTFALLVAKSDDTSIQHILMDAFDKGVVNSSNFPTVRRIVETRMASVQSEGGRARKAPAVQTAYSVKQLRNDIARITREKEAFVREAGVKENRLIALLQALNGLWQNADLVALVKAEGMDSWPQLSGTYTM